MKVVYYLWILLIASCGIRTLQAGQPPAEEKRSTERGSQDRPQGVPLDKLPVPENGVIVVTPDLKKALDALGAGSVVLSAERYLELMNKAEKSKTDIPNSEMLFAKCRISGEVNQVSGREYADLVFELEFRTETPNAVVPIPFKGIRISSASINGQPPIWGPEPEKWTLLIKEPQVCRLKLSISVPIIRGRQEKRLTLERVPASAITSLELTVPGKIPSAMVLGYGSITASPVDPGKTRFSAPALGVLSSLELTWQSGEAVNTEAPASIEGDIRVTLEESQAQIEARFKPVPFAPIQLPWKVRLPKNSQQVRAELARTETGGTESLVVTRQTDGTYILTTPYAVNMSQFSLVGIRWRQPLPEADSAEPILLGSCELIEPAGKQQDGTLQAVIPEEQTMFLKPSKLISTERNFLQTERENRRNPRYRYTQQPAGLEAIALPRVQTRGLVEARLQHTLGVQERAWFLNTDIEIVRSNRANLSQLELDWPADWQVSRKLLFSPAVKEIEQDTKAERLRIFLDGRQPSSFTLKLESILASTQNQMSVRLPQLLSAQGLRNERSTPLDVIIQQERLRLDARGWNLQVAPGAVGIRDETTDGNQRADTGIYVVTGHPAQLKVQRQPRLPKWTSKVEAYVGKELLQTRQSIQVQGQGSLPRQLTMLVPRSVKTVQFTRMASDLRTSELLHSAAQPTDEGSPFKKYTVDLPVTIEKSINLLCLCEQEARHPITLPLVRVDESIAIFQGAATVQCFYEAGLKLAVPAELPGWQVEKQEAGTIELQGDTLQPLLVLERSEVENETARTRFKNIVTHVEQEGAFFLVEQETALSELRQTTMRLNIAADRTTMTLLGWKLDDRSMPFNLVHWNEIAGLTTLTIDLPPEKLFSPAKITVALRLKREGISYLSQLPGMYWNDASVQQLIPVSWHLKSDSTAWLLWASERTEESRHSSYAWLPTSPEHASASNPGTFFELHGLSSSSPLRWLVIPRSLSVLLLSALALFLLRVLRRRTWWVQRFGTLFLALLLILLVLSPGLAVVLFWGAVPGLLIGLAIPWLIWQWFKEPRKLPVFQTTGLAGSAPLHSLKQSSSTTEAATMITSPQRLR